jgi:hypothetical protein
MAKRSRFSHRLYSYTVFAAICGITILGLIWLNNAMEIRYQAIGVVTDNNNTPIEGVEAILLLAPPPPTGAKRDELFSNKFLIPGSKSPDKTSKTSGPIIGISDSNGNFLVRSAGRLGPAHAIRLGLDSSGKPPFKMAWLVLRKQGYQDTTMAVSTFGWVTAPQDWGKIANQLPRIRLTP